MGGSNPPLFGTDDPLPPLKGVALGRSLTSGIALDRGIVDPPGNPEPGTVDPPGSVELGIVVLGIVDPGIVEFGMVELGGDVFAGTLPPGIGLSFVLGGTRVKSSTGGVGRFAGGSAAGG